MCHRVRLGNSTASIEYCDESSDLVTQVIEFISKGDSESRSKFQKRLRSRSRSFLQQYGARRKLILVV